MIKGRNRLYTTGDIIAYAAVGLVFVLMAVGLGILAVATMKARAYPDASSANPVWAYDNAVGFVDGTDWTGTSAVLVDQYTGVRYLMVQTSSGVSVTPLLENDGTPSKVVE